MTSYAFLMTALLAIGAGTAQDDAPPSDASENAKRIHESLIEAIEGDGDPSKLRIELMDGSRVSHRSYELHAGKLVSKEFAAPGAPMVQRRGVATDARVRDLLRDLVAKRYWRFQGTRFVPDAPTFLFRIYGPGESEDRYVDFSCDHAELRTSPERAEIRGVLLDFVASTEMVVVGER